jgi:ABC-type multidrug transport system ATPase subunit
LSTHSKEADALSDRVAVIVEGGIKCQGPSLYFKKTYGDGYQISLVTRRPDQLIRMVYQLLLTKSSTRVLVA